MSLFLIQQSMVGAGDPAGRDMEKEHAEGYCIGDLYVEIGVGCILPGGDKDLLVQHVKGMLFFQTSYKVEIFHHHVFFPESAQVFKDGSANEERLVAAAGKQAVVPGDKGVDFQQGIPGVEAIGEASGDLVFAHCPVDIPEAAGRRQHICMHEVQHVAAGASGGVIHLRRPASFGGAQGCGAGFPGGFEGIVGAAAVTDDDFQQAVGAVPAQVLYKAGDVLTFIQRWDDDAYLHGSGE